MRPTLVIAGLVSIAACSGSSSTGGLNTGTSSGSNGSGSGDSSGAGSTSGSLGSSGSSPSGAIGSSGSSPSGAIGSSGSIATSGTADDSSDAGTDASVGSSGGNTAASPNDAGFGGTGGSEPSTKFLPTAKATCPTMTTGTPSFNGTPVQIWAGTPSADQHGPLLFYWYGTGGHSSDAELTFGQAEIQSFVNAGGLVASFTTTLHTSSSTMDTNTGDSVWYTSDFAQADEVLACAISKMHIDTRRIYATGASAGALQTVWMAYARSGYLAAVAPLSGGLTGIESNGIFLGLDPTSSPQDPTNVPAAMVIHGALGKDVVYIDFAQASAAYEADIAKKGGYSMDCNTGGGHVSGPPQICPSMVQFFQDHPFNTKPDPYANGIPAGFPSYCVKGPRGADGGAP